MMGKKKKRNPVGDMLQAVRNDDLIEASRRARADGESATTFEEVQARFDPVGWRGAQVEGQPQRKRRRKR